MAVEGTRSVFGPGGAPMKSPYGSFAGKATFVPKGVSVDLGQLDQGVPFHSLNVGLGPTLGEIKEFILPQVYIQDNTTLGPKHSVVLVNTVGLITVQLPDVQAWILESYYNPYTNFQRSLWIKDMAGNAGNITIIPFGSQTIDAASSYVILLNYGMVRLYPILGNPGMGWYSG